MRSCGRNVLILVFELKIMSPDSNMKKAKKGYHQQQEITGI